MKTISRNRSSLFTTIFVLGGLGALYFYRRNGGKTMPLLQRGSDAVRTIANKITTVAPAVADDAESATSMTGVTSRSRAHEIPMAPEDMDRFPAT